ncbi:MAG: clostripain-related cysteine peptidase [Myxococcales bacterium]
MSIRLPFGCLACLALFTACSGPAPIAADSGPATADSGPATVADSGPSTLADAAMPADAAVARGGEGEPCNEDGTCETGLECFGGSCLAPIPAVQDLAAAAEDYAVALSWTFGDASARFELSRRREGEAAFEKLADLAAGTRSYRDEAIELGVAFQYSLTAFVGGRASLPSAPVLATAKAAPREWTLIYFIASDGDYGYTYWFNVDGLEAQGGTTAEVGAVALYDGYENGDSQYLVIGDSSASTTSVSPPRAAGGEVNMGEAKSYTDFIDWLLPRYSARHYLLSFHDHGGGAVEPKKSRTRNMLYDQSSADSLDPDEQGQVVRHLARKIGRKVDVVESMTCLGQMAENTWGMRDAALYHVGAESLSYVTGTYPLGYLAQHPAASAKDVALFLAQDHASGIEAQDVPCTWSAIDLGQLGALGTKLGALAGQLKAFATTDALKAKVRAVAGGAQNFSYQSPDLMAAYLDIKDLAAKVAADTELPERRAGDLRGDRRSVRAERPGALQQPAQRDAPADDPLRRLLARRRALGLPPEPGLALLHRRGRAAVRLARLRRRHRLGGLPAGHRAADADREVPGGDRPRRREEPGRQRDRPLEPRDQPLGLRRLLLLAGSQREVHRDLPDGDA